MTLILRELKDGDENAFLSFFNQLTAEEKKKDNLSTILYAFVNDEIIGRVSINHYLTENLLNNGGHLSYLVNNLYKDKGYTDEMLNLGLTYAYQFLELNDVLLTCLDNDFASINIIEKNGGILENKIDGYRRYWIHNHHAVLSSSENNSISCVILAGGKGSRMKSDIPKVMHPLLGKPLLQYVLELADRCNMSSVVSVVSKGIKKDIDDLIKRTFPEKNTYVTCVQEIAQGTGDAVKSAFFALQSFKGNILILSGDVPALKEKTVKEFVANHNLKKSIISVLTFTPQNPSGYGRIVKNKSLQVTAIVEHKDATDEQLKIFECNSGIYCVQSIFLWSALRQLCNDNAQKEYYLTDIVAIANQQGLSVSSFQVNDEREVMGINSMSQLFEAEAYLNSDLAQI